MNETAPRVIKIPAKPESVRQAELQRQLRVAAYCRVSTKEEDQTNSYEVQKEYYTDKIMSNPAWTMTGIFADKGIAVIFDCHSSPFLPAICAGCGTFTGCTAIRRNCWQRQCV